jgi:transmembrane sensor
MNQQIYQEASEWLVDFRTEEPDHAARKRFERWLSASPEHVRAYLELTTVWETVAAQPSCEPQETDVLIQRARSSQNVVPLPSGVVGVKSDNSPLAALSAALLSRVTNGRALLSLAATVLFAFIVAGTYFYTQRDTYSTAVGEQRSILLPDGSIIDLNALSKVRIHFAAKERHIDLLEGQALFRVAKDRTRPFIVAANDTLVRAVGTQFDINQRKRDLIVTVVEGTVAVETNNSHGGHVDPSGTPTSGSTDPARKRPPVPGSSSAAVDASAVQEHAHERAGQGARPLISRQPGEILLGAGQQVTILARIPMTGEVQVNPTPRVADLDMTRRRLIFDSTSLEDVAEEFNRNSERPLVIDGTGLEDFHISGAFSSADPQSLLRFLRAQPGIQVTERDGRIVVSRSD